MYWVVPIIYSEMKKLRILKSLFTAFKTSPSNPTALMRLRESALKHLKMWRKILPSVSCAF